MKRRSPLERILDAAAEKAADFIEARIQALEVPAPKARKALPKPKEPAVDVEFEETKKEP